MAPPYQCRLQNASVFLPPGLDAAQTVGRRQSTPALQSKTEIWRHKGVSTFVDGGAAGNGRLVLTISGRLDVGLINICDWWEVDSPGNCERLAPKPDGD